jgi:hypothetical protein
MIINYNNDTNVISRNRKSTEALSEARKLENKKSKRDVSKYLTNNKGKKPRRDYNLLKDIKTQKLFKANVEVRDTVARKYIDENYSATGPKSMIPGQMLMFNYFEPHTKDELEYYDAMPLVIFFGIHKTSKGKRVIGFNLHYFPPRMRYQIINRIYEIFKPFYLKSYNEPLKKGMTHFDYHWMIEQMEKAKLDFGVRQYDPALCGDIKPIPTEAWAKAIFTEGHFKKSTRDKILQYWRDKKIVKKSEY